MKEKFKLILIAIKNGKFYLTLIILNELIDKKKKKYLGKLVLKM